MGTTPSAEHKDYDLQYRLLEEGRSGSPPPPPTAAQSPSPSPSPSPHGGASCTTSSEPPRRRARAWAISAIRGCSITLCPVILVFLVAPLAMTRPTNKDRVFLCVSMFFLSFAFPVMGYGLTWDLDQP